MNLNKKKPMAEQMIDYHLRELRKEIDLLLEKQKRKHELE